MSALRRGIDQTDWTKGAPDAPVTLLEYGDFQCPYCGAAHMHLKRLEAEAGDAFRFSFRHFPLTQMHPDAMLAAEAAEAAGAQGKFWPMHDLLFEHQDRLDPHSLLSYAGMLGLDLRQFASDLQSHRHAPRIRRDFMEGLRSGVNGTPTFFLNGLRYDGPHTFQALLTAIREGASAAGMRETMVTTPW